MTRLIFRARIVPSSVRLAAVLAVLFGGRAACVAAEARWQAVEEPIRFLRQTNRKDGDPEALQVAIVRCRPIDGAAADSTVDLVAAVHVAEPEFYAHLNRDFARYDAVLYELVAPEGTRVKKDAPRNTNNPLSLAQHGLTDLLELQFQLEGIDYGAENLIHADMSPEQFTQSMEDRGESFSGLMFRMMGYSLARQNEGKAAGGDVRLLWSLFSENRAMALRRVMAEQFNTMQGAMAVMDGPDGSTLIAERNKVALEVLKKELDNGKRKIAIFYGAGHMDDMLVRLRDGFGIAPKQIRWVTAWKLQ